jgi:aspartyl/asparaginyl beta-hydroxylase (cupin superfamily)
MSDFKKYLDVSEIPLVQNLKNNFSEIRKEFFRIASSLTEKPNNTMTDYQKSSNGKILYDGKFQLAFTRVERESCSIPEFKAAFGDKEGNVTRESIDRAERMFEHRRQLTPTLESCLLPYINDIGTVGFNVIYPGTKLNMHYGMSKNYIRIHMGLLCDPGAVFYVEDLPPRTWEPGKVFAFSDGDTFHGTVHNGELARAILLIDLHKRAFKEFKDELWP